MDANNSFYVESIATYAPTFLGYIISVLAIVLGDCAFSVPELKKLKMNHKHFVYPDAFKKGMQLTWSRFWSWLSILFLKLFWPTVRNNCSSDGEKLLKFEAEVQEFANFLRLLAQFIQTVKCHNIFWNRIFFNLFLEISQISYIRTSINSNWKKNIGI